MSGSMSASPNSARAWKQWSSMRIAPYILIGILLAVSGYVFFVYQGYLDSSDYLYLDDPSFNTYLRIETQKRLPWCDEFAGRTPKLTCEPARTMWTGCWIPPTLCLD